MKRLFHALPASVFLLLAGVVPAHAQGAEVLAGLRKTGSNAGFSEGTSITLIIGNIIQVILGLTGVLFVVLIVSAGIMYMTAGGQPEKVGKAKQIITNSVIGLVIIVAAYAISEYVITALVDVTTATSPGGSGT